jgi:GNAT superfamily N-acetyltransferase
MLTPPAIRLSFALADETAAAEIAALRVATARDLTAKFGRGHWSGETSERGVLAGMRESKVWVARRGRIIVATFRMSTTKPWAIDRTYFAKSSHPLYLTDMAVQPQLQGQGIGRRCLDKAVEYAKAWPADAIRLDAYDAEAGAGEFYAKSGFREVGHAEFRGVPLTYYEWLLS